MVKYPHELKKRIMLANRYNWNKRFQNMTFDNLDQFGPSNLVLNMRLNLRHVQLTHQKPFRN